MKRIIKTNIKTINIIVELDFKKTDHAITSSDKLLKHQSINKKYRVSDEELVILHDIVYSVLSCLTSRKFKIIEKYQSARSYTYYVQFMTISDSGEEMSPVNIKFRIADHDNKYLDEPLETTDVIIKSITIGDEIYHNSVGVVVAFSHICSELKKGNLDILNRY